MADKLILYRRLYLGNTTPINCLTLIVSKAVRDLRLMVQGSRSVDRLAYGNRFIGHLCKLSTIQASWKSPSVVEQTRSDRDGMFWCHALYQRFYVQTDLKLCLPDYFVGSWD